MKLSSLFGHVTEVHDEIVRSGRPADRVMDHFFRARKYLGSKDRRFIAETVYDMLRHRTLIESSIARSGLPSSSRFSAVAAVLIARSFPEEQLTRELDLAPGSVESLQHAVSEQLHGPLAVRSSYPEWMTEAWIRSFGTDEAEAICTVMNTPPPMTIRVNTLKITREECRDRLFSEGLSSEPTVYSPFGLTLAKRTNLFQVKAFTEGLFEVQDEGSQILSLVVDPKPRTRVIDGCAGAGGKSLAMAAVMKNTGEIFALDVHTRRLDEMKQRLKRAGVDSIRSMVIEENVIEKTLEGTGDFVLVDAPCSGTGTIRRNPGMKWSVTPQTVAELSVKQASILELNAKYVRPGGVLVYATCSLMDEENEQVVQRFLTAHPEFERVDPAVRLARYGLAHLANNGYVQLLPHRTNTDGFYAAVMARKKTVLV